MRASFASQAVACERLGSPLTAQICRVAPAALEVGGPLAAAILGWKGDPVADALALRLCGALHALSWEDADLAAVYPPAKVDDARMEAVLRDVFQRRSVWLFPWLNSAPQTNEVNRSAVLIGGLLHVAARDPRPIELLELGASGGLNQVPDLYRYRLGGSLRWGEPSAPVALDSQWRGAVPPMEAPLKVVAREGCDIAPIDVTDAAARRRMEAYIWPDQTARLVRIRAALEFAAHNPPKIAQMGAADFLADRLSRPLAEDRQRVVIHSIMWQYMPAEEQARAEEAIRAAGTTGNLSWLRLEPDEVRGSAAVQLTTFPEGETQELGRGDFHGAWAEWHETPKLV
ncbi:DUF2332 domain-containing protein [Pontivivens ytuae]|uniref:DUF2332 domain-containing protein n=1 Tax=Pontivivens ytuae TaxID=2789856 RepID=A0A7S9LQS0_9RHOB|nr:DUF2332 domain-containing protein [Pontivivens ytuae]QPH53389.1 DUF2332 domain-containing protein [Pontivivens ytuae]